MTSVFQESATTAAASPKKRPHDKALEYLAGTKNSVVVTYKDLKYLCERYMLNDIIIDFYLRYVLHDVVPQDRYAQIVLTLVHFSVCLAYEAIALGDPRSSCSTHSSTAGW